MSNLIEKLQELNLYKVKNIIIRTGRAPATHIVSTETVVNRLRRWYTPCKFRTRQRYRSSRIIRRRNNLLKKICAPESILMEESCLTTWANGLLANPKMGKSNGMLTLQGYGERKAEFSNFCKKISLLNKHLIFVAHRQTQQEGDEYRYVPLFGGSNYDALVTELDLVGYMEAQGKKRTITFDPTSRNDGKNTCNLPSIVEVPNTVDDKEMLKIHLLPKR